MADFNNILPTGVDIQRIQFVSNQQTVTTRSLSGRTQVRSFGGQVWTATITMPMMRDSDLKKIYGFLVKQRGALNTFTISPFPTLQMGGNASTTEGISASSTTAQKAIGSTSIEIDDPDKFKAGDMIKFSTSGHTKAYMITQDQNSDNTINFEPGLVQAVADTDDVLSGSNFELTVRLAGDEFVYEIDETGYGTIEFDVVEVV